MAKGVWKISDPTFESDKLNPQLKFAYWEGHRNFIYDFLNFVKPQRILELGSQYGCSLFAMAQSVKDHQLESEIKAVDFWKGDIGAPDAGEKVFSMVQKTVQKYYREVPIKLYQMGFDDARPDFQPESVDLIHIDGGHRYEDVDHDFNMWLPTLRKNGVILFHDVYSTIDRGSCDHWQFIKQHFDVLFDFPHSCGLGVLFPKGDFWYQKLIEADFFPYIHDVYIFKARANYVQERFDELAGLYEQRYQGIEQQSKLIKERDETIAAQGKMLEERYDVIQQQSKMIADRDAAIQAQKTMLEERYAAIQQQSEMIAERDAAIQAQKVMVEDRYAAIQKQSKMIAERDEEIQAQKTMLEERYAAIQQQSEMIADRDAAIQAQKTMVEDRYAAIQKQSEMIAERDKEIQAQKTMLEERYAAIQQQSEMIAERDAEIQAQKITLEDLSKLLQKKNDELAEQGRQLALQDEELRTTKRELEHLKNHYWKIKKPSIR